MLPRDGRSSVAIQDRQEIDRSKFPVDGGWPADFGADAEIGAEEFGRRRTRCERHLVGQRERGERFRAERCRSQVFFRQAFKHRPAQGRILRSERAAADHVAAAAAEHVAGDFFPEQTDDRDASMVPMHAGAAQFDEGGADRFIGTKIEFPGAVITERPGIRFWSL